MSILIDEHRTVEWDVNKIANLHCIAKGGLATLQYGGEALRPNEFERVRVNGFARLAKKTLYNDTNNIQQKVEIIEEMEFNNR